MTAYAITCIVLATLIVVGAVSVLPVVVALRFVTRYLPAKTTEVSEDDYPTSPIPIVPGLPPVPPDGPAPSQHFTDGYWGSTVSQDLVDREFRSLIAFQAQRSGPEL